MRPPDLHDSAAQWCESRTFFGRTTDLYELCALKATRELSIGVCLPALDEASTIGAICGQISDELIEGAPLVDELVVLDSGSTDGTREVARAAGAKVYEAASILPSVGPAAGKGDALWKSLAVLHTDLIVYLDSDVQNFRSDFVVRLVEPLLRDPTIGFVKAFYERPLVDQRGVGGGRVTELVARPLINAFYPELAGVIQPLAGEYAGRSELLRKLPFFTGYAVEIGLLIDVLEREGLNALAQADLGERVHRNRPTIELGPMAYEIMRAVFTRLEDGGRAKFGEPIDDLFVQFDVAAGHGRPIVREVKLLERPPMEVYSEGGTTDGGSPPAGTEA